MSKTGGGMQGHINPLQPGVAFLYPLKYQKPKGYSQQLTLTIQKQPLEVFCRNRCYKIHTKTPVPESLF